MNARLVLSVVSGGQASVRGILNYFQDFEQNNGHQLKKVFDQYNENFKSSCDLNWYLHQIETIHVNQKLEMSI